MDINSCSVCAEALNNENTEVQNENEDMEVTLYEDMKKSQILTSIADSDDPGILCAGCKGWLEKFYLKEIEQAQRTVELLDKSIETAQQQKAILDSHGALKSESYQEQMAKLDKENSATREEIKESTQKIRDTEKEIERVKLLQTEVEYNLYDIIENNIELLTRNKIIEEEIRYLDSSLLAKLFFISSVDKIGTINNMRLGRLDSVIVPWGEINAAWGCCVFLLSTLMSLKSLKSKIINLYPLGAFSRISYQRDDEKRYELFFADYSYSSLIVRYNNAQCLFLEALREYEENTRETGSPYSISNGQIGGLSINFEPSHKERWTQALRFLLQDLNYFLYRV